MRRQLGFAPASDGGQSIQPITDADGFITGWGYPTPSAAAGWIQKYKTVLIIAAAALFALAIIKAIQRGRD